jgi:hypothetical protein
MVPNLQSDRFSPINIDQRTHARRPSLIDCMPPLIDLCRCITESVEPNLWSHVLPSQIIVVSFSSHVRMVQTIFSTWQLVAAHVSSCWCTEQELGTGGKRVASQMPRLQRTRPLRHGSCNFRCLASPSKGRFARVPAWRSPPQKSRPSRKRTRHRRRYIHACYVYLAGGRRVDRVGRAFGLYSPRVRIDRSVRAYIMNDGMVSSCN